MAAGIQRQSLNDGAKLKAATAPHARPVDPCHALSAGKGSDGPSRSSLHLAGAAAAGAHRAAAPALARPRPNLQREPGFHRAGRWHQHLVFRLDTRLQPWPIDVDWQPAGVSAHRRCGLDAEALAPLFPSPTQPVYRSVAIRPGQSGKTVSCRHSRQGAGHQRAGALGAGDPRGAWGPGHGAGDGGWPWCCRCGLRCPKRGVEFAHRVFALPQPAVCGGRSN